MAEKMVILECQEMILERGMFSDIVEAPVGRKMTERPVAMSCDG